MSSIKEFSELGGFLEFEHFEGKEIKPGFFDVNYGRNALRLLIRERNIHHIYLPDYNCDSVVNACKKEDVEISEYEIGADFLPQSNFNTTEGECLYLVDYWGRLNEAFIDRTISTNSAVILDFTHSFFKEASIRADVIYSCRKFFGVPDGAYISPAKPINRKLQNDCASAKILPLVGRFEEGASQYYKEYRLVEEMIEDSKICGMSLLSHNILRAINYNNVRKKRNSNFAVLDNMLHEKNEIDVIPYEGPYVYPLLIHNGDALRKKLVEADIFVPCLWRNVLETARADSFAYYCASNLVPLPVDQRYGEEHMRYIGQMVLEKLED